VGNDADEIAIELIDVSVCYRLPSERINNLKEQVIRRLKGTHTSYSEFWALSNISLRVRHGESIALLGRNGAGKSTMLKVIARVQRPTQGRVIVRGNVAPLIELGAGFHSELTGRENIYINGAMLGFSRKQMDAKFESIVEFSELGSFIDSPIRAYSSGMVARLGFAIAADADPDILIVDEALAVGDEAFQQKCLRRMEEFRRRGVTQLYVTHAVGTIHELCTRAVWLDGGRVRFVGDTQVAVQLYRASAEVEADLAATQRLQVVRPGSAKPSRR
jgi:ABC-type polysaccharide/polyol phosphate transport system ATPase subunit